MRLIQKSKKTNAFISILFIGITLSLIMNCSRPGGDAETDAEAEGNPENTQASTLAVEALEITRGQLVSSISASGTIEGIREAFVVSETQGIVEQVSFELGQSVEKGQILLQVDDEIPRLNMQQAEEQLENARIDYQTTENLVEKGGAARADLLRSRSALRGAEARYKQARKVFLDCAISSPISGYVAQKEKTASLGNYLSPGMTIARLVDLSGIRLEVAVGEGVIGLIEQGSRVMVTVPAACEEKVFEAAVTAVAAGSSIDTGSYRVVIEWVNECGPLLKSGMSAEAEITPGEEDPVVILPTAALLTREGKQIVFVDESGTAVQREVRIGRRLGGRAEVLTGVDTGDKVLLSGITRLSAGDQIDSTVIGSSGSWK